MTDRSLHIASIRHWLVYVPFVRSISWASGTRAGSTRLVVEITTESGLTGYGETICLLDFVEPVLIKVVEPLAIGRSITDAEGLHRHVEAAGYYHHKRAMVMATAAVEMAMWDALGKHAKLPLCELWGGRLRDPVEVCAYLFVSEPDELRRVAKDYLDAGYRSFKLKVGLGYEQDLETVAAVRETIGPEPNLRIDANSAWTPGTARRLLRRLERYDLQYAEQPLKLDDLIGHAALRRQTAVPIAIDEGAYTVADISNAVRLEAADVILLDPHEQGGLWQSLKGAAICEPAGIPLSLHSGGELGLSQSAYLHLAASIPNLTIAVDTEYDHHADDILADRLEIQDGMMRVPPGPGLGVEPDLDKLVRFQTDNVAGAYLNADRPDWVPAKPAY